MWSMAITAGHLTVRGKLCSASSCPPIPIRHSVSDRTKIQSCLSDSVFFYLSQHLRCPFLIVTHIKTNVAVVLVATGDDNLIFGNGVGRGHVFCCHTFNIGNRNLDTGSNDEALCLYTGMAPPTSLASTALVTMTSSGSHILPSLPPRSSAYLYVRCQRVHSGIDDSAYRKRPVPAQGQ